MSISSLTRLLLLAAVCTASAFPASITAYFTVTNGGFTPSSNFDPDTTGSWAFTSSGWNLPGRNGMDARLTSPTLNASGGAVSLQFTHTHNFEGSFDGGVLELSVNGGAFSYVPGASFSQNGYNVGSLIDTVNPLSSLPEVYGGAGGPKTSIVGLGTFLATDTYAFRFRAGYDPSVVNQGGSNWLITSLSLTNTEETAGFNSVPEPSTAGLILLGTSALVYFRRRR